MMIEVRIVVSLSGRKITQKGEKLILQGPWDMFFALIWMVDLWVYTHENNH